MIRTDRGRLPVLFTALAVLALAGALWLAFALSADSARSAAAPAGTETPPASVSGAALLPPTSVTVTPGASQELEVSYEAPGGDDALPVTGYKVQWKSGTEGYDGTSTSSRQAVLEGSDRLNYTIAGLTNGTEYTVRVVAYDGQGKDSASAEVTATPEAPNVIVILVDDLGYVDVSFNAERLGIGSMDTPNLDELAEEGVVFTNGYVTFPTCTPSRSGLLTGRYPSRFGVEGNIYYNPFDKHLGLPVEETTFPTYLQEAGYRTGAVGKWQLGGAGRFTPLKRGFDYFYGFLGGLHDYWRVDASRPADVHVMPLMENKAPASFTGYLTDALTDKAIEFVQGGGEEPFFLYLAYNAPHGPLQAPEELIEKYADEPWENRRIYLAMVDSLDQNVGRLLEALEQSGERDNTIVFFLSDNGGKTWANNYPFSEGKGSFQEGGVRVPFIASWPARWPQGQEYEPAVISLDIAATVLGAAKAAVTDEARPVEGVDLDPYLRGEEEGAPHEALYWRASRDDRIAVVRSGDWKLIHVNGEKPELYNVGTDPDESEDVFETNRRVAAELAALWNEWNGDNFAGSLFHSLQSYEERLQEFADNYAEERRTGAESLSTHRIEIEPPSNSPATGAPTVGGTAQVGETLTADTSGIGDEDGLDNATFAYQWVRRGGTTDTDIAGATNATYTLADADEGGTVRVRVSFTDDAGNAETLTSAATAAVTQAPVPLTANLENTPESHDGETPFTFELRFSEDFDLSYATLRDHAFTVTGGEVTGARRLDPPGNIRWEIAVRPDSDAGVTVVLPATGDCEAEGAVCTEDGRPLSNRTELTVPGPESEEEPQQQEQQTPENSPATGAPAIGGTAQVGETLTADTSGIADADGLDDATYGYQWLADDTDIQGATGSTYTPVSTDKGKTVKVRVSFTDDGGNEETLTSEATAAVAARPNSPATGLPAISGTAQVGETLTADTSGVADGDGLDNAAFTYQWITNNGTTDTDIQGATASTYIPVSEDEGKTILVRVSFTDDAGHGESLTSSETAAIAPAPNSEEETGDDPIWSATLTAEWVYEGYGYSSALQKAGSLSPVSFEADGVEYTVNMIEAWDRMSIGVDREVPFGFVLELDGARFDSSDATFASYSYSNLYWWEETDLRWGDGDTIEIRLFRAGGDSG